MDKLHTSSYIADNDPAIKSVRIASEWYATETRANVPESSLGWMISQGWTVTGQAKSNGVTTYNMSRRYIDPEKVLGAMISDYTAAYNEGRVLNDQRYDDIIAIYCAVQDKFENDNLALAIGDLDHYSLMGQIISSIESDHTSYAADISGSLDNYGVSLRAQINSRFDSRLASSRQELVSRGMYNSTLWTTVSAGIERERSLSLSDLEDKLIQQRLSVKRTIKVDKDDMRAKIMAARDRLRDRIHSASDKFLEGRNAIVTAIVNFMERRTDGYPSLSDIGNLAANLGAGNPAGFKP